MSAPEKAVPRAHLSAAEWNKCYPIGTRVRCSIYPGEPPGYTTTRSEAWTLGHGEPVVKVDGVAGGVALWALEVLA